MSLGKSLKSLFSAIWAGIDGLRKVMHLLLLLFVFGIIFGALSSTAPLVPASSALLIQPVGSLVEELEGDPYDRAIAELLGESIPQTLVQDVVDGLKYAKEDSRIEGVVLDLSGLGRSGLSQLERVGNAIDDFRASDKPIVAVADFYGQGAIYLASRADEVYMHPEGAVLLSGFGSYRTYYRAAIEKLKIDWNIFRVGTHKSAVEPYMRDDMSEEDRSATVRLVDQLWERFQADIVRSRELEPGSLDERLRNFVPELRALDGDLAELALESGLVDGLMSRAEFNEHIMEWAGTDPDDEGTYHATHLDDYVSAMRLTKSGPAADANIAIVVAAGEILNGTQSPGTIGGDSTADLLRQARLDESVKAVVLRVDSPGGSAFASEIILDEIERLQTANKPVVASMSSVAASGGYWISMAADRIYASEVTITGSIGIFGMLPTFQRSLREIGINTDGTGTSDWSGQFRVDRAMSDDAKAVFQMVIDKGYDDFISKVASYRGMEKETIDGIAQGQVWTGSDALENGLIDGIGGLDDAVAAAAELAELAEGEYGRKYIRKELTPTEQLALDLFAGAARLGIDAGRFVDRQSTLQRLARVVETALDPLLTFNDPKGMYSHCFCTIE
ncbi:MAG: signal peptide peptidase SppA [Gammaproteobacteria bacterium]|nr:signal peptide peptidase SppA [Gammaproteobacteria bacterium]MDH5214311.1 signal peptide peptidase SppA [Gammaproteobacteria bacterium]